MRKSLPLNVYGVPINYKGKVPCRCNKRACQQRKTLSKYPEEYDVTPKCSAIGCDGILYVDKLRLQAKFDPKKMEKDSGKFCRCSGHPKAHPLGKVNGMYVCEHHEDVLIEKSFTKGTFKHSPIKKEDLIALENNDEEGCPF